MKRQIKSYLLVLLFLFPALCVNAQWKKTALYNLEFVGCLAQSISSFNGVTTYYQYAGTSGGVFISTNYGDSWTPFNTGLYFNSSDITIKSIITRNNVIYAAGYGGVFRSTNWGIQWTSIADYNNGFSVYASTSMAINDPFLYASSLSVGVMKSTDNGTTWTSIKSGLPQTPIPDINQLYLPKTGTPPTLFAATSMGIFANPNNGNIWYPASSGIPPSTSINAVVNLGSTMLAGTINGLYHSSNNGTYWYQVSGVYANAFYCFAVYGNFIFAGTGSGVFVSTDTGYNWTNVSAGSGIDYTPIYSIAVFQDQLMVGTYQKGVWKRKITEMTGNVSVEKENLPNEFELKQNYPNPFNPATTIEYSVPMAETQNPAPLRVLIKIYDVLGREIQTLVDDYKTAGNYSIQFNGTNLPSGIYYYVLNTGNSRITKKMTLLK